LILAWERILGDGYEVSCRAVGKRASRLLSLSEGEAG